MKVLDPKNMGCYCLKMKENAGIPMVPLVLPAPLGILDIPPKKTFRLFSRRCRSLQKAAMSGSKNRWKPLQVRDFCGLVGYIAAWYPKEPVLNGCLVKQPYFFCNDLESSSFSTSMYKQIRFRFQVFRL